MKINKLQILVIILVSCVLAVGIYFLIKHFQRKEVDKKGWDQKKIKSLSDAIYTIMKADPDSNSDIFQKACASQKLADCMAASISKNYPYDPKYAQNPTLNIPSDSTKYTIACFSTCLGTKNNWSKVFYNEILQEQISAGLTEKIATCYTDYLEKNIDPIDLLTTTDINSLIKDAKCKPQPSCDCTQTTCGETECAESCTDCKICACPKGKKCFGSQCLVEYPDCDCDNTKTKNCGDSNGCGDICDKCPDGQLCDRTKCVSINNQAQNGWTNETIQNLSGNIINTFDRDTNIIEPVINLINNNIVSDCMANIITNEYTYDSVVTKDNKVDNYNDILKMCASKYLGKKGQWSTTFYNEIQSQYLNGRIPTTKIECMMDYLEYNYSPVDLYVTNINDALEKAQSSCRNA